MAPVEPSWASRPRRWCQSPPKTPEPASDYQAHRHDEQQEKTSSSPPTRLRFRLRRRTAAQRNAPTTQFLASVAAADLPLPSIEEPQVYDDEDMLGIAYPRIPRLDRLGHSLLIDQPGPRRTFSPPKTPAPGLAPSLSLKQFPDWTLDSCFSSLESSPEYESSRPSTARSTQTSSSLFSQYSFASEGPSQCASPESERLERFVPRLAPEDTGKTIKPTTYQIRSAKSRRAPWTEPMNQHLWSTYMTYLQDPKVTPFRVGKSGIPPSGVCMRVAREAKRSWKGSRPHVQPGNRSGSSTPTAESAGPYIEWPHTCAATRGRLRELCKAHSAATARHIRYMSNSPTPFRKTGSRFCARPSVPARSPSVFSAADLAMSLAVSTADSMQSQGPLAQLTRSQPESGPLHSCASSQPSPPCRPWQSWQPLSAEQQLEFPPLSGGGSNRDSQQSWPPPRLGSPFVPFAARSYGPSSTSGLTDSLNLSESSGLPRRQSLTVGERRGLRSPVRLDPQSRSSLQMQKRRSKQPVLEPRRTKRPSLGSDFWIDPSAKEIDADRHSHRQSGEFSSIDSTQRDNLFVPRTNLQELFEASRPTKSCGLTGSASFPIMAALSSSCQTVPARLGSPFSGTRTTSHSFPNRHLRTMSSLSAGATFPPLATAHHPSGERSNDNGTASGIVKTPLMERLAYIDKRLKNLGHRGRNDQSSQSPA
ncbi:hypothetical protein E4U40_001007 [Claviceps sp. LM458 group G5]|nr:hypothetical protein E4U40_001007 [Claviceps sp. LM458 group G5]